MIRDVNVSRWSTTFRRFEGGPIHIGPIGVVVSDWSRPQPGRGRMFASAFLERMAVAGPFWPLAVYVPAGLGALVVAAKSDMAALTIVLAYVGGLLAWSLAEYVTHRFLFHHAPTTRLGVAIQYLIHGVHHAFPDDSRRWMIPLSITLPVACAIAWGCWLVGGPRALPGFAGFLHGYLAYDLIHHSVHARAYASPVMRWLRAYHMRHHYAAPDRQFGVSSGLWDVVFRTNR